MENGNWRGRRIPTAGWGRRRADENGDHHVEAIWESAATIKVEASLCRYPSIQHVLQNMIPMKRESRVPAPWAPDMGTKQHPSADAGNRRRGGTHSLLNINNPYYHEYCMWLHTETVPYVYLTVNLNTLLLLILPLPSATISHLLRLTVQFDPWKTWGLGAKALPTLHHWKFAYNFWLALILVMNSLLLTGSLTDSKNRWVTQILYVVCNICVCVCVYTVFLQLSKPQGEKS